MLPVEEAYPLLKPDTSRFDDETWFDNNLGRLGIGVGDWDITDDIIDDDISDV